MSDSDFTQRFLFDEFDARGELVSLRDSYAHVLAKHPYPQPVAQLLGELLAACPQAASRPGLAALAAACTQADSHLRPGFGQIVAQLSAHAAALQA